MVEIEKFVAYLDLMLVWFDDSLLILENLEIERGKIQPIIRKFIESKGKSKEKINDSLLIIETQIEELNSILHNSSKVRLLRKLHHAFLSWDLAKMKFFIKYGLIKELTKNMTDDFLILKSSFEENNFNEMSITNLRLNDHFIKLSEMIQKMTPLLSGVRIKAKIPDSELNHLLLRIGELR